MPTDPLNTPAVPLSLLFLICMTLSPTRPARTGTVAPFSSSA